MFQKYVIQLNWVSCQIGKEKTLAIFGTGYTLCKICLIGILQPQFCRGHYLMLELAAMRCFLKICIFEAAISNQLSRVYKEKSFLDVCRKNSRKTRMCLGAKIQKVESFRVLSCRMYSDIDIPKQMQVIYVCQYH